MDKQCELCNKKIKNDGATVCQSCGEELLEDHYREMFGDEDAAYFVATGNYDIGDKR